MRIDPSSHDHRPSRYPGGRAARRKLGRALVLLSLCHPACWVGGLSVGAGKHATGAKSQPVDTEPTGFAVTCTRATALFRGRADKPDAWHFFGYLGLEGPVACPPKPSGRLPATIHSEGMLITAGPVLAEWRRTEQDSLRSNEVAYMQYVYRTHEIVFADKVELRERVPLLATEWTVAEALGKPAPASYPGEGKSPTSAWVEKLGAARPVYERFYRRQGLSRRTYENERNWAELNVTACFEEIGKSGNFCGAESRATMHPTSAQRLNPYAEAWFCQGWGHLNHPPRRACHGVGTAASSHASCVIDCGSERAWARCRLVFSRDACLQRKAACLRGCPPPPKPTGAAWLKKKSEDAIPAGAIAR